jgi:Kef-type K+ transport system membrane component KefB
MSRIRSTRRPAHWTILLVVPLLAVVGQRAAWGAGDAAGGGGHTDPFAIVLIGLAGLILAAMLGRWAAARLGQPSVLGELLIGVIVGNVGYWLGRPAFVLIMHFDAVGPLLSNIWTTGLSVTDAAAQVFTPSQLAPEGVGARVVGILGAPHGEHAVLLAFAVWMFSNLGVILLLLMVGLESSVAEMLTVGPRALAVAVVGIVGPFVLGFAAAELLLPQTPATAAMFIGATLCATSVGITARVFKDLGRLQTPEAKVILGAAVIDDVLGLIVLAIVVGMVASGGVQLGAIARIAIFSALFLGAVIFAGERLVTFLIPVMDALDGAHLKLLFPLALACATAWLASQIELASIVGAFAAGLVLNETLFPWRDGEASIEEMLRPLEAIFAPIFFVLMGMQVNLASFLVPTTLGIAAALVLAGTAGKIVAGLGAGPGVDRLTIGLGMVPRGEVGLIFASIGKGIGVVDEGLFSAIVVMVIVTTLLAPPLLKWSLSRAQLAGG